MRQIASLGMFNNNNNATEQIAKTALRAKADKEATDFFIRM